MRNEGGQNKKKDRDFCSTKVLSLRVTVIHSLTFMALPQGVEAQPVPNLCYIFSTMPFLLLVIFLLRLHFLLHIQSQL